MTTADTRSASRPRSGQTAGLLIFVAAMLVASGIDVFVRFLSSSMGVEQIIVLRGIASVLVLMPWILHTRGRAITTGRLRLHLIRGGIAGLATYLMFLAIAHLPLAEVNAYFLTESLFVLPLAIVFLGERVTLLRLSAMGCGAVGVLVVLWPDLGQEDAPALGIAAALGSAFCLAVLAVLIRKMAVAETTTAMVFYQQVVSTVLLAPAALAGWRPVGWSDLALVAGLTLVALAFFFLIVAAYRRAEATLLSPAAAVAVPFGALAGWVFFDEVPTPHLWAGAALIVLSLVLAEQSARWSRTGHGAD